ncbi:MAG: MarR family transcriptional regulator [Cocleimonas sp.]|nr:MarR family transcriptional regulator [Cocleimonas sp.]
MKEMVQEEDSGLSMLQITLLRILTIEGEKSLIEIAQIIGKDKSQITRTVQELEKMGIVRKERSEKDRRSFILKLNVGVKEKVSFYIMKEQELIDAMLAGVSQNEQEILDKLLLQMHVNLTLNS